MKFTEYKNLNLPQIAAENIAYWDTHSIFEKSISQRDDNNPYIFYEGPPSANGLPGIHHVMARSIKDIFCRYKTQKGYQVKRKAGWDTHGLPVELGVEKQLGITKEDIGKKISVEQYNNTCREAVMKYTDIWNDLTKKMGYWVDMENPYITYKSKYMETVWWLLKNIYDKDLLYKGYSIQPYSPKAGTGLSSHELNQPGCYKDVTDTTVVAQFKAIGDSLPNSLKQYKNLHLLAWTTTPWTLPSNTALTVGPKINYIVVKTYNQYTFEPIEVLLAKNLISKQFSGKYEQAEDDQALRNYTKEDKKIPYLLGEEIMGKDLENIKYEQLLPYTLPYENPENAFRVITADFVTIEDGTGIVHTAPTFGVDDAKAAQEAKPPVPPMLVLDTHDNPVPLIDLKGKFVAGMNELSGKYVKNEYYNDGEAPDKSIDVEIAIALKEQNKAFKVEKYVHSYPHCWRTDKPVLYYPLDSWFIKVTAVKDRLTALNDTIQWKPSATGEGRFGKWLSNANDWNLSRSRYWGIPLPIWRTEQGDEEKIIGSIEELKNEIDRSIAQGLMQNNPLQDFSVGDMSEENYAQVDLHKHLLDDIIIVSDTGKPMKRESDLIDVWFDSGAMPFAQWHYPFEISEEDFFDKVFPADFIAEGVDQTRGWFYTLHVIATIVCDRVSYKNVISNGLVLDKEGRKMSKRLGNAIEPFEVLDKYGADATRWYMINNSNPWDSLKFDLDSVAETSRKFFGTLYNTYSFFALYANIDRFTYQEQSVDLKERPEIDQWILSELHSLIETVDDSYEQYEPTKAARAISYFVQEYLSNWYVRLCRRRFWKGEYQQDKIAAYQTLYECLLSLSKLIAPIAPFYSDTLYRDLIATTGQEQHASVHLSLFPVANQSYINKPLQQQMRRAQMVSSLVLSLRKKERIKVRQPLSKIIVSALDPIHREEIIKVSDLIKSEVNVKEIELLDRNSDIIKKSIKPNFKTLGPKYGPKIKQVAQQLQQLESAQIQQLEQNGHIDISLDNQSVTIELSEVEIVSESIEGFSIASNQGITIALDVVISDDLRKEGLIREVINRVQNIRKEQQLEVTDRINVTFVENPSLREAIKTYEQHLKTEVLIDELTFANELTDAVDISFDEMNVLVKINKID